MCLACYPLVFMLPETHGPTILKRRARALRAQGHIQAFSHEEIELKPAKFWDVVQNHLMRASSEIVYVASDDFCRADAETEMLIYEPICQGAAIWLGLAYGII
jgi:hypothetical protein